MGNNKRDQDLDIYITGPSFTNCGFLFCSQIFTRHLNVLKMLMNLCYSLLENQRRNIISILQLENGDRETCDVPEVSHWIFQTLYLNHNTFLASDYLCFGDSSLFKFCSLEHFSLGQIHAKLILNLNKYLENPLSRRNLEFLLTAVNCKATKREAKNRL